MFCTLTILKQLEILESFKLNVVNYTIEKQLDTDKLIHMYQKRLKESDFDSRMDTLKLCLSHEPVTRAGLIGVGQIKI